MLTFLLSTLRTQLHFPPVSVVTDGKPVFILIDIFLSFLFSLIVFKLFCSFTVMYLGEDLVSLCCSELHVLFNLKLVFLQLKQIL